ncbi:MAG: Si-specific NAD(P)(+) transhydrogenase [Spirochaetia bacterium]|nr:Si-specific NAD(P)(+) transhydrogenase [Spirochaetia bacterium]
MKSFDYDILIIGSGPGGKEAAITAAQAGKKVGIIERKPHLGGVSLQTGTIPSKALREAAYLRSRFAARGMRKALGNMRAASDSEFLMEAIQTKNSIIEKQESLLLSEFMRHGISIIPGEGNFHDEHTIKVRTSSGQESTVSAKFIILATGSRPRRPEDIPFDREVILDSTSLLKIRRLPESMIVVGGGVIACELATMFTMLGVSITMIDPHPQLLSYLDQDIISNLTEHMKDMEIDIHLSLKISKIERINSKARVTVSSGQSFEAQTLLYAMGRQPNTEKLGLDALTDLATDKYGYLPVNENQQTQIPHIYTVGDLAGWPALAATASEQGRRAVSHAYQLSYRNLNTPLPMAIYTIPELSYAGYTEKELLQKNIDYAVGIGKYSQSARGQIIGSNRGILKVIAEKSSKKLLGVHIIGENASELVHVGQMVLRYNGDIYDLANHVYNYPTLAECYKTAALDCLQKIQ